ncbi:MAG: hypothetical protein SCALA702_15930 [Melioribacteraceae bacterium]|nr:MAG: hypothetical protein SCALA702_15930 [Melioribacteraceae bacterium]
MEYSEENQKYKELALKLLNGKKKTEKLTKREIELLLNILSWKINEERELIKELCNELSNRNTLFD